MLEVQDASVVVDDITLLPTTSVKAARGQALIVRGRNGSGKSTLLRVVAGALKPTSGTVRINGHAPDQKHREFRRQVAAMIGLPPIATDLTVRDHVALVASTWSAEVSDAEMAAEQILSALDIAALGARFPHELSSGQTQLFGLCLVMARPFELLVLDEPEQRLDPERLTRVCDLLSQLRDDGTTLLIATHSLALAERLADQEINLDRAA